MSDSSKSVTTYLFEILEGKLVPFGIIIEKLSSDVSIPIDNINISKTTI